MITAFMILILIFCVFILRLYVLLQREYVLVQREMERMEKMRRSDKEFLYNKYNELKRECSKHNAFKED